MTTSKKAKQPINPPIATIIPLPTAVGQMLVSTDGATWSLLDPPGTPNNQALLYGTTGPYWANNQAKPAAEEPAAVPETPTETPPQT